MSQVALPHPPAWRRIADALAASIDRGEHPAGETLPAASEVATRYGVHRHTVRQAYLHLQDLGLVSIERGRGTLVTGRRFPYRIGRRVSFRENFRETGLPVEGEILRGYVTRGPASVAESLGAPAHADLWRIRTRSSAGGKRISTALHYLDAARFPRFGQALADARASITAALRSQGISDYVRLSTRVTARAATAEEAALLDIEPGAPCLRALGIDGEANGRPLQVVDTLFVAERVELLIEPETPETPEASNRAPANDRKAQLRRQPVD